MQLFPIASRGYAGKRPPRREGPRGARAAGAGCRFASLRKATVADEFGLSNSKPWFSYASMISISCSMLQPRMHCLGFGISVEHRMFGLAMAPSPAAFVPC
eukprot:7472696-Pyramimonas_sp.AAC.1